MQMTQELSVKPTKFDSQFNNIIEEEESKHQISEDGEGGLRISSILSHQTSNNSPVKPERNLTISLKPSQESRKSNPKLLRINTLKSMSGKSTLTARHAFNDAKS